ncbi:MAG: DNA-processing protein DprA [Chloroflexi bacterium]|nr:DNA-processing protein DprA [Chloroflexota bacterium]MCL5273678.1 DNA-processing protein DprA [Chloroflexota bacterium]
MSQPDHRAYLIALARIKGIGPVRLRLMQSHFPTLYDAWNAHPAELLATGLDQKSIFSIVETRRTVQPEAELERILEKNINVLTWDDAAYPKLLRQISDPPPVLYVRGQLADADAWAIGMVGTRRATVYGREVTEMLAGDLARNHITVVSGMARGIDAYAHQAAIKAGGRTLAVLGCGVDITYPPEHRKLAQEISENGALVSDYPPGTEPDAQNFPPRNRIISGLSLGVVVVEADEKSGALITSDFALEQGREVFAVPGNIFNRSSRGANKLIQQGAKLVLNTANILEELNLSMVTSFITAQAVAPENDIERSLLAQLSHEPVLTDDLVNRLNLPTEVVTGTLALMELKGMVRQASGTSYVLAREERLPYV